MHAGFIPPKAGGVKGFLAHKKAPPPPLAPP